MIARSAGTSGPARVQRAGPRTRIDMIQVSKVRDNTTLYLRRDSCGDTLSRSFGPEVKVPADPASRQNVAPTGWRLTCDKCSPGTGPGPAGDLP